MVGLGVQQADAQTGANDAGVIIDKGAALVGVELGRKPAAADRFFERLVKGLRVGLQKIAGVRNQARVIIDDDTQLSICQTCKYSGLDFLDFLLSGEKDIDGFAARCGRRPQRQVESLTEETGLPF
jgi:hypothetical protein